MKGEREQITEYREQIKENREKMKEYREIREATFHLCGNSLNFHL